MSCFYPMQALRLNSRTASGKQKVVFLPKGENRKYKENPNLLSGLPCGQCSGCRLERSRQWAIRMMNEAQLHSDNCFLTLTFDDSHLSKRKNPMSLDKRDFQLFMKKFRKRLSFPIRYFMCGEYGDLYQRPHYHAIIFGFDPVDKQLYKIKNGMRYYTSDFIRESWPFGFNVVTDVTFDSCAYVARYIMKKQLGPDAWQHYFDDVYGHRLPEYTTMSRRPGIGKAWLDKYLQDVYPRDEIFRSDKKIFCKPPKAYDSYYEVVNPEDFARIKEQRNLAAALHAKSTQELVAAQTIKEQQIKILNRELE